MLCFRLGVMFMSCLTSELLLCGATGNAGVLFFGYVSIVHDDYFL